MSAIARAFPGLPQGRAERIAYFERRIAEREAADPDYPYKLLFAWADPDLIRRANALRFMNGVVVGLSEHHEWIRRCHVLRAWCAKALGWETEFRRSLQAAAVQRRLARSARLEGR